MPARKARNDAPETLLEAVQYFADPDVALAFVANLRWPKGPECPLCGTPEPYFLKTRRVWKCAGCKKQFSVKVGTIFEDSPIALSKWLPAMWLLANCKNGISSYELARAIGVTQKTAWFMLHRIRLAMQTKSFHKIGGEVELDETFIGGKARNMPKARRARVMGKAKAGLVGKVAVLGLLERHGEHGARVHSTHVLKGHTKLDIQPRVRANVEPGADVFTDASYSYHGLDRDYVHSVIDHAECYAKGKVHTNGLENFWSLLKRAVKGTYVSVEPFHLFRYLDEQTFRFNNRKDSDRGRFVHAVASILHKRLTYCELTGARLCQT